MTKLTCIKSIFVVFLFFTSVCFGQPEGFQEVKGLPTKEVYDLLIDKKGFLWIAHNLGVSRYDGVTFTNFSNPEQTSSGMSGLMEDSSGRIWCYNFSSQVFYIENEKMELLREYNSRTETAIPKMLIFNNVLYVTSIDGLFTYDLATHEAHRYITGQDYGIKRSMNYFALLHNKILINGLSHWYLFDPSEKRQSRVRWLSMSPRDPRYFHNLNDENNILNLDIHLFSITNNDTIYGILNQKDLFLKMKMVGDSIKLIDSTRFHEYINTMSWSGDKFWLNTREKSIALDGSEIIKGGNLSDLLIDKEGNTWCSSLTYGLLIRYKNYWKPVNEVPLQKGDYITRVEKAENKYVYGTQMGEIIVQDAVSKVILSRQGFPIPAGSVEFIKYIGNSRFIIGGSLSTFALKGNSLTHVMSSLVKDAVQTKNGLFIASNTSLIRFKTDDDNYKIQWQEYRRCLQLAYDSNKNILLARFANNVCEIDKDKATPIKNSDLPLSGLYFSNGNFYFTAFNGNLYLKNDTGLVLLQTRKTRFGSILFGKVFGSHIWIIKPEYIRVYDTKADQALFDLVLPPLDKKRIYDLFEENNSLTVFTSDGVYGINLIRSRQLDLKSYLVKVSVNNIDTLNSGFLTLPYAQNNIDFYISAPYFTNADQVFFKYRLRGSTTGWDTTEKFQRKISYAALEPGKYLFEAIGVNPQTNTFSPPLTFGFEVLPPWYESLWFKILVVLLLAAIYYSIYSYRKSHRNKLRKLRTQITADLHDDIGATLSSINIYAELAKTENNDPLIETIQNHTQHAIASLEEVVWNLNRKSESIKDLVERMKVFALPLLAAKNIECSFEEAISDGGIYLQFEKERNSYLIFKELINNVAKHSGAKNCKMVITQTLEYFFFTVTDDGKGFDTSFDKNRNGLGNLKKRADEIDGHLTITTSPGKGTIGKLKIQIDSN
jgi:two-component sensor histidine kinase